MAEGKDPFPGGEPSPHSPAVPFRPQEHMTAGGNCQTFSSSTVISYSNTGAGAPKVYQETAEMRSAPGGVSWRAPPVQRRHDRMAPTEILAAFFRIGSWAAFLGWCSRALEGAAECAMLCLPPDPGDSEDCTGLGQWAGADVHWASHPRQGSHPAALPKPPHGGPGGAAGLYQPG